MAGKGREQRENSGPALWRIGIYIRLSKQDGSETESESVVNQRNIIAQWLEDNFDGDYEVAGAYVDDGETGTDTDREQFRAMERAIDAGRINCVVVKNLSRLFRHYAHQGFFLENYLPLRGVRFISISGPAVDSLKDPEAILTGLEIPINGLLNDRYAAKTSMDVRRTFDAKRRRGEFIGSHAPYGYRKDPADKNRLLIDEEAAAVVRDIFRWYVREGYSKRGIAARLNAMGVPSPTRYKQAQGSRYQNPRVEEGSGGLWSPRTVGMMLGNRVYAGDMVQGRHRVISHKIHKQVRTPREEWYIVPGTHQPIVACALFAQAARLLERDTRTAGAAQRVHLFGGMLRCADCGGSMHRKAYKPRAQGGPAPVYYYCRTYKDGGGCSRHSVREDVLSAAVLEALRALTALLPAPPRLPERSGPRGESVRLGRMLARQRRELDRVVAAMAALYRDRAAGELSEELSHDLAARFEQQHRALHSAVTALEQELRAAQAADADRGSPVGVLEDGALTGLDRSLLVELVERIAVHETGALTITLAVADCFQPGEPCPRDPVCGG